jgi:carbamoylphosphate synthase small subunit
MTTCASRSVVGIADIDTRRLTRILREKGAQNGCLMAGPDPDPSGHWRRRGPSPGSRAWTWRGGQHERELSLDRR